MVAAPKGKKESKFTFTNILTSFWKADIEAGVSMEKSRNKKAMGPHLKSLVIKTDAATW